MSDDVVEETAVDTSPHVDELPQGDDRKRFEKGRRCRAFNQYVNNEVAMIAKTVHDPKEVLDEETKARVLEAQKDGMAADIQYSMNKARRWEEVNKVSMLNNADVDEVDVTFVEKTLGRNDPWFSNHPTDVNAVHTVDKDGNLKTFSAQGEGAKISALLGEGMKKSDPSHPNNRPRIDYRLSRPHPRPEMLVGKVVGRYSHKERRWVKRDKNVNISDMPSDERFSMDDEEPNAYKPSRDFRFSLADYLPKQAIQTGRRAAPSDETSSSADCAAVVVDLSPIIDLPNIFERTTINTGSWKDFDFDQQMNALIGSGDFVARWIDANQQRVLVDMTSLSEGPPNMNQKAVVVMEKFRHDQIRLLLNSSVTPSGPFSSATLTQMMAKNNIGSIQTALHIIQKMVQQWEARETPMEADVPWATTEDSPSMIGTERSESFSSFEMVEAETGKPMQIVCVSCHSSLLEDLFELEQCWQCANCLRQNIIHLIQTDRDPLDIPFITGEGSSVHDVLPALVPLTLIDFYYKISKINRSPTKE